MLLTERLRRDSRRLERWARPAFLAGRGVPGPGRRGRALPPTVTADRRFSLPTMTPHWDSESAGSPLSRACRPGVQVRPIEPQAPASESRPLGLPVPGLPRACQCAESGRSLAGREPDTPIPDPAGGSCHCHRHSDVPDIPGVPSVGTQWGLAPWSISGAPDTPIPDLCSSR